MQQPAYDWYLAAWARSLHKRQVDFVNDLDWNKGTASLLFNCKQPYTRELVNEAAAYLNILPHELLMHPADAAAIRQLRAAVLHLAVEDRPNTDAEPPVKKVSSG